DAVLISFDVTIRGREALREYFRTYLERLGTLTVTSTDKFTETEDSIFFEATVASNLGTVRVYDAFVLRDGKISYHFAGAIGHGEHLLMRRLGVKDDHVPDHRSSSASVTPSSPRKCGPVSIARTRGLRASARRTAARRMPSPLP